MSDLPISPEIMHELIDAILAASHATEHIADVTATADVATSRSMHMRASALYSDLCRFLIDLGAPDPREEVLPGFIPADDLPADLVPTTMCTVPTTAIEILRDLGSGAFLPN